MGAGELDTIFATGQVSAVQVVVHPCSQDSKYRLVHYDVFLVSLAIAEAQLSNPVS